MATDFNITMKQYNGVDYDTLYPKTTSDQIIDTIPLLTKTSGTLSVARGGTGGTTAAVAMNNLIATLSTIIPESNDIIPLRDVSNNNGAGATISQLISSLGSNGVITTSNLDTQVANLGYTKIQTGSYVGTGTYGSSNPCSLTFDFVPKLIVMLGIYTQNPNTTTSVLHSKGFNEIFVPFILSDNLPTDWKAGAGFVFAQRYGCNAKKSNDGRTIYWYQSNSADYQFNMSEYYYAYAAIG